ncbi:MAG TPA: 6-phosphogluconolactonase [Candidatus Binatia bacterium]|nr:6-phosphogluconolactonase [Candidatus Binatia bacterium]
MKLDVYATDAEAFEAAAALVARLLRDAARERAPAVALSGGRGGRGVMVALAGRGDLPWERVEWFWGDERCVPPDDARSNVKLARDSLLVPRGVAAARIHPPPAALGDPAGVAAAYAETLCACLGAPTPVFDVVLLGMGRNGHVASLMPGAAALRATAPVAPVPPEEVSEDPRVARITVTPPVLAAARHVVVTVTGAEKAAPLAAALRDPVDPVRVPAALVRPSPRVLWVVDEAAAGALLAEARPAEPEKA